MDELDMLTGDIDLDEIVDIDLDIDGGVMPPKNNKIALVDADTVAYTACLNVEFETEVLPREFYSDMEWDAIVNSPQYDEVEGVLYEIDPKQAVAKAQEKINRILEKTGCKDVELHFSGNTGENFRFSVFPEYKSNRTGRSPAGLHQCKEDLCKLYNGTIHTTWEADDAVVFLKETNPEKYILCAIDKDVINSIEGTHFNYYESALYKKEMKWVDVDRHTSLVWRYLQTLTGDKTDGIIGLHGIGPKKAEKILANKYSHAELWEAVCEAYVLKGRTRDEALMNLNLVDMKLLVQDSEDTMPYIKLRTHEELLNV